jgi:predicted ester cyclase
MERNREVAIRWFEEVWSQRKIELIPELALPNAIGHDMEGPGVDTVGLDAFSEFQKRMCGAIPDLKSAVVDTIAEGDRVVVHVRISGTHSGGDLGIPPTGNVVDFGALIILRFENGKIAEAWNYLDQLAFYQQLRILNVR